jgi:ATP-dependent DNA helicase RecG
VEITELAHPDGRVVVFEIPPRPAGTPLHYEGAYLMRAGEDLVPMSADQLRRIISEGQPDWFEQPAKLAATADEIVALLDTQSFFELYGLPYPTSREGVLARLAQERLIVERSAGWEVSNLAGCARGSEDVPAAGDPRVDRQCAGASGFCGDRRVGHD